MAERAFASLCVSVDTVKATFRRPVCGNVFVAVHTQFGLLVAIERNVAGPALGLEVCVTGNHFARHDQRFQLCLCDVKTECSKH